MILFKFDFSLHETNIVRKLLIQRKKKDEIKINGNTYCPSTQFQESLLNGVLACSRDLRGLRDWRAHVLGCLRALHAFVLGVHARSINLVYLRV